MEAALVYEGTVPRSWTITMAILILCLLASIVLALIKLV
jgi:hypothetical protein